MTCPLLPPEALKNEQKVGVASLRGYRATGQSCPHAALVLAEMCAWAELANSCGPPMLLYCLVQTTPF